MSPKNLPQAHEFMNRRVYAVEPHFSLVEVINFLKKHRISSAPVVVKQESGISSLVGFISEADCLEHLANEMFYGRPAMPQNVQTMMKRHPVCVPPETDIFSLASIFINHGYRHLPVVNEEDLLGIVSRRDILEALDHFYRASQEEKSLERFPPDLHQIANLRFVAKSL